MKCSELTNNDEVVFKIYCDIMEEKIYMNGTVLYTIPHRKEVCVSYMKGYKHLIDNIPYRDMVAAGKQDGKYMEFDNIKGVGILLVSE